MFWAARGRLCRVRQVVVVFLGEKGGVGGGGEWVWEGEPGVSGWICWVGVGSARGSSGELAVGGWF